MKRFLSLGILVWLSMVMVGGLVPQMAPAASALSFFEKTTCDGKPGVKVALPIFSGDTCIENDAGSGGAIIVYAKLILRLLSGVVGIVIFLMLVSAGIQYITSIGDPKQIQDAKNKIQGAITALALFLFMFALLSFLLPGGILS